MSFWLNRSQTFIVARVYQLILIGSIGLTRLCYFLSIIVGGIASGICALCILLHSFL